MNQKILEHIKNEKDISRYKISILKTRPSSRKYKHRLISIEQEFIEYPFEKINFKDLNEVRSAISIFKTSRSLFADKYEGLASDSVVDDIDINLLGRKLDFFEKKYKYLLDAKLKKINIFEDLFFKEMHAKAGLKISKEIVGPDTIARIEGASIAKKRARTQILVYCLARYIYHKIDGVRALLETPSPPGSAIVSARDRLDNIFLNAEKKICQHFNDGIREVPLLTNGTLGDNRYIPSIYPLVNIFDSIDGDLAIKRVLPIEAQFFSPVKLLPIKKRSVERGFSIVTPISRIGNEAIELLYLDLWSSSGVCLNDLVEDSFYNYKSKNGYFKAVSMIPMWKVKGACGENKFLLRQVLTLIGLANESMASDLDLNDPNVIDKINNCYNGSIKLSADSSRLLIPATRSEAGHIKDSMKYIELLITEINDEYNHIKS